MLNKKAFTILEVIIVIIILSVMAGFALPAYNRSIRSSHEQDSVIQLTALHAANEMYEAQADEYLQGNSLNLTQINNGLNISIIPNGMTYSYTSGGGGYTTTASWDEIGAGNDFTVRVNATPISASNPCCSAGNCPSLPACS